MGVSASGLGVLNNGVMKTGPMAMVIARNPVATTAPQMCHVRGRRRTTANRPATASPPSTRRKRQAYRLIAEPRGERLVREAILVLPEEALIGRQRKCERRIIKHELRPIDDGLKECEPGDAVPPGRACAPKAGSAAAPGRPPPRPGNPTG